MLLLSGTVSNSGDKALVPSHYNLEIKLNDKWIEMKKTIIPEGSKFEGTTQDIKIDEAWKADLQKEKVAITKDNATYGHLMFFDENLDKNDFVNSRPKFKLICTDIHGKKYTSNFFPKLNFDTKESIMYPKHGITVQPKINKTLKDSK